MIYWSNYSSINDGYCIPGFVISPKWTIYLELNDLTSYSHHLTVPIVISTRLKAILDKNQIKPVAAWENLDLPTTKQTVMSSIRKNAGVYGIINLINGDIYVGSGINGRMHIRFHKHLYGLNGSYLVSLAVKKYGLDNFAFIIIETIEDFDATSQLDNQNLLDLETNYINNLPTVYNIARVAGNTTGVLHSEETKVAMRVNYSFPFLISLKLKREQNDVLLLDF